MICSVQDTIDLIIDMITMIMTGIMTEDLTEIIMTATDIIDIHIATDMEDVKIQFGGYSGHSSSNKNN